MMDANPFSGLRKLPAFSEYTSECSSVATCLRATLGSHSFWVIEAPMRIIGFRAHAVAKVKLVRSFQNGAGGRSLWCQSLRVPCKNRSPDDRGTCDRDDV